MQHYHERKMRPSSFGFGLALLFFVSRLSHADDPISKVTFDIARYFPLRVGTYWAYQYSGDIPTSKSKIVAKESTVMLNGAQATLLDEWRYGWQAYQIGKHIKSLKAKNTIQMMVTGYPYSVR